MKEDCAMRTTTYYVGEFIGTKRNQPRLMRMEGP